MSERPSEITDQNVLMVDVDIIAKDRRFPELKFTIAKEKLSKVQKWFLEAQDLNYEKLLIAEDLSRFSDSKNKLKEYFENLLLFDTRTTRENAKQEHDSLEVQIDKFFNEVYQQLAMRILPFLRQEAAQKSQDKQSLVKEQKVAAKARKQYEELSQQLRNELESLQQQKKKVETAHEEVASKYLAVQFKKQAEEYEISSKEWLSLRNKLYRVLIIIIGANFLAYLTLFILDKVWGVGLPPSEIFTLEYGLVKLALLAVLSYGVGFASKNYNVSSHLAAINKHRRNVAQTLDDFLSTSPDRKAEMLRQGTEAMFKHVSIGYIRREEQKDSGPIYEIINKVIPNKEQ